MHEDLVAFKNAFFEENKTLRGWMEAWWATQGWNAMVPSEQRKFSLAMRAALKAGKKWKDVHARASEPSVGGRLWRQLPGSAGVEGGEHA